MPRAPQFPNNIPVEAYLSWHTADGRAIPIHALEDDHLRNCIFNVAKGYGERYPDQIFPPVNQRLMQYNGFGILIREAQRRKLSWVPKEYEDG